MHLRDQEMSASRSFPVLFLSATGIQSIYSSATMQPLTPTPLPLSSNPAAAARTLNRRWGIVGLLFTASLINYFDRATMSMALPTISKELHLDPATKGVLLSAFFWSYAFMQIPI